MRSDSDRRLANETTQRHLLEFDEAVMRTLPRLRRIAMRFLRNHEDAEDAVQEALLSAYKNLAQFEGRAQMSSWLMAIVINKARMHLRRNRFQFMSLDSSLAADGSALSETISDPRPTPEQAVAAHELSQLIELLAGALPTEQRTAFQLWQRDQLSTREAATILGLPEGTLKTRVARAKCHLVQRLRHHYVANSRLKLAS